MMPTRRWISFLRDAKQHASPFAAPPALSRSLDQCSFTPRRKLGNAQHHRNQKNSPRRKRWTSRPRRRRQSCLRSSGASSPKRALIARGCSFAPSLFGNLFRALSLTDSKERKIEVRREKRERPWRA